MKIARRSLLGCGLGLALAVIALGPAYAGAGPESGLARAHVVALPAAPARAATNEVEGDDAFKETVRRALEVIGGTETGKTVLDKLRASKNTHTIRKTRIPSGSKNTPDNSRKAGNRSGTGTTTLWDPKGTRRYDRDVRRDPTAALLHELVHACDADLGTRDASVDPDSKIKRNEIRATRIENNYRAEKNLPPRQKYGGKPLPR